MTETKYVVVAVESDGNFLAFVPMPSKHKAQREATALMVTSGLMPTPEYVDAQVVALKFPVKETVKT